MNFDAGCALVESALTGPARREIVAEAAAAKDFGRALVRLRDHMRANIWPAAAQRIDLERIVNTFDRTTRQDGFHEGVAHQGDARQPPEHHVGDHGRPVVPARPVNGLHYGT